jgi:hypothetical protein
MPGTGTLRTVSPERGLARNQVAAEQGGEVVGVKVDDPCQPRKHRLPRLVMAQLVPPGAGTLPVRGRAWVEVGQGGGAGDVEVGVDGLVAELGPHGAGAQCDTGVQCGPVPPMSKPGGDITGAGGDLGDGGWVERHTVHARVGAQERVAPHDAVAGLRLRQDVLGSAHQAASWSSSRASWMVIE